MQFWDKTWSTSLSREECYNISGDFRLATSCKQKAKRSFSLHQFRSPDRELLRRKVLTVSHPRCQWDLLLFSECCSAQLVRVCFEWTSWQFFVRKLNTICNNLLGTLLFNNTVILNLLSKTNKQTNQVGFTSTLRLKRKRWPSHQHIPHKYIQPQDISQKLC